MSIQQIGRCFYTPSLRPNQRLVAIALADYADDHGRAFPSLKNIAEKIGYSRRQTQRLVSELVDLGYVEILIEATWNRTPLYQLNPEALKPYERIEDTPLPLPPQDMVQEHINEERAAQAGRGDNLTPPAGDDNLTPRGDTDGTQEVTNGAGGGDTGDTLNRHEPSEEPSQPSGGTAAKEEGPGTLERFTDTTPQESLRPRNRAWDALFAVFEYQPEGSEQALWGRISRRAHESANDPEKGSGDPALEVFARAKRLMAQWGAKALTPPSLEKHWDRFGSRLGAITGEEEERLRDEWNRAERRRRLTETDATRQIEEEGTP